MEPIYTRTPAGDNEIEARTHRLERWSRTVLIVIGKGKSLKTLERELRKTPTDIESILADLKARGLISCKQEASEAPFVRNVAEPVVAFPSLIKETRRYFTYLIGIVENKSSSRGLALTIALKRATTEEELAGLRPLFLSCLQEILGEDEASRLLGKIQVPA